MFSGTEPWSDGVTDNEGSLTEREVQRIVGLIEALERSSFDGLEVEIDGLKLTLGRGGTAGSSAASLSPNVRLPSQSAAPPAKTAAPQAAPPTAPAKAPAAKPQGAAQPGALEVRAPLRGIFYGRADPSSPPFVTLGAKVSAISTIGLVEVMKVFNAVPAGHEGEVVEICAEDGQAVEAGQVLLRIASGKASA